jgi:hypothetical protein
MTGKIPFEIEEYSSLRLFPQLTGRIFSTFHCANTASYEAFHCFDISGDNIT